MHYLTNSAKFYIPILFYFTSNIFQMEYAVISVPAAPVRRKPGHRKEMVNQLLFGESVRILKKSGNLWVKIRSLHDGYEGWMTHTLLTDTDKRFANSAHNCITTDILSSIILGDKRINVPVGSSLPFFADGKGKLGTMDYSFSGHYFQRDQMRLGEELVIQLSSAWLNAPYLWGGRTPLGVDCSGLVQVIYKLMGIDLPRDAWQQAQEGEPVKKLSEARTGDLAYFDNKEDIVHVGIILGNDRLIHASGKVRIDNLSKKGIESDGPLPSGSRLRAIRRYW
jgi:cell wall-associated NlpC family hydrolase